MSLNGNIFLSKLKKYITMNKNLITMTAATLMLATSACVSTEKSAEDNATIIGKQEIKIENGRLTPEALWAMGRIGSSTVSPDGKKIAYTVSYYSVKENKSHTVIYMMNADGSENTILTTTSASEYEPAWIKNGEKLAFLSNGQIWEMNPDGTAQTVSASLLTAARCCLSHR